VGLYLDQNCYLVLFLSNFFHHNFVRLQIHHGLYVCFLSLVQDLLFFMGMYEPGTRV
jgi:hypothetical protein